MTRRKDGIIKSLFSSLFDNLNISKKITNYVLDDPHVQKEIKQVQNSMKELEKHIKILQDIENNGDDVY